MGQSYKETYRNVWSGATFVLFGPIEVHQRMGRSWQVQG